MTTQRDGHRSAVGVAGAGDGAQGRRKDPNGHPGAAESLSTTLPSPFVLGAGPVPHRPESSSRLAPPSPPVPSLLLLPRVLVPRRPSSRQQPPAKTSCPGFACHGSRRSCPSSGFLSCRIRATTTSLFRPLLTPRATRTSCSILTFILPSTAAEISASSTPSPTSLLFGPERWAPRSVSPSFFRHLFCSASSPSTRCATPTTPRRLRLP